MWTTRKLNSVQGRLLHYSVGVRHQRVLVTEMQPLVGPVPEEALPGLEGLSAALSAEMCAVLQRYGPAGWTG